MKVAINGATTMPYSLKQDLEAASRAGFDGVEIWKGKLDKFMKEQGKEELKSLLSSYGLEVAAICPFSGYVWCSEKDLEMKMNDLKKYLELCPLIGCRLLLVCAETLKSKKRSEVINAHVQRLSKLADLSEDYDVEIALEWFSDLRDAVEIVNQASHDYLKMMMDTFHWYRGDGDLKHIDVVPSGKLSLVHINDSENLDRGALTDKNRLYCGYGVIPLVEILKKLKKKGYEGYLSVEIFRDEYWERDPFTISDESFESVKEIIRLSNI